jgi:hypothetical protein
VQHDQDAVGVAEVALVLLDPRPGQRAAELGEQRAAEQLRHREIGDVGELGVELLGALAGRLGADAQARRPACRRVAHRFEHLAEAALAVVLDDDAGGGTDVGLEVGLRPARDRRP